MSKSYYLLHGPCKIRISGYEGFILLGYDGTEQNVVTIGKFGIKLLLGIRENLIQFVR